MYQYLESDSDRETRVDEENVSLERPGSYLRHSQNIAIHWYVLQYIENVVINCVFYGRTIILGFLTRYISWTPCIYLRHCCLLSEVEVMFSFLLLILSRTKTERHWLANCVSSKLLETRWTLMNAISSISNVVNNDRLTDKID